MPMRTLLLLLCLTLGLLGSDAAKEAAFLGVQTHYAAALSKAKKEQKILLMIVVKENCPWCHRLIHRTLGSDKIKPLLNRSFVTLVIDRHDSYPSTFNEDFFPAIFYVDPESQQSIYEEIGYVGVKAFLDDMQTAKQMQKSLYSTEKEGKKQ